LRDVAVILLVSAVGLGVLVGLTKTPSAGLVTGLLLLTVAAVAAGAARQIRLAAVKELTNLRERSELAQRLQERLAADGYTVWECQPRGQHGRHLAFDVVARATRTGAAEVRFYLALTRTVPRTAAAGVRADAVDGVAIMILGNDAVDWLKGWTTTRNLITKDRLRRGRPRGRG
jgi:hypothetical protein